jgi:hypothetical protein
MSLRRKTIIAAAIAATIWTLPSYPGRTAPG